jgi:hypothetical protein
MMDANLYGGAQQAKVHVLDATGKIDLVTPFSLTLVGGWNTVSIPSALVSGDFYVAFECGTGGLDIRIDTGPVTGHSFIGNIWESDGKVHFFGIRPQWNYMIRAYVDPAPEPAPVGGVVIPANAFVLISPWLAVIGLVGCIGTVVVVAKKRQG